ncbi:MAG: Hsp20/alpha crystallin family protein [Acidobacteria bacterium]|nr:Hsp20/alpha crystallin family protein [Acidobacteriota bacterium]MYJ03138.1 Hsp20/alpha crystallin family protein [Acidobacteriota bacterium]
MDPAEWTRRRKMLSMTRWNPFVELNSLHREMDRVFGRFVADEEPDVGRSQWVPATEISAGQDGWTLRMALPGIDPNAVQVDLHGSTLTITGERTRSEGDGQRTSEFHYGRFERSFTLPANVDAESVSADFTHGMLALTLPLAEAAKPRRISINGAAEKTVDAA